MSCEGEFGQTVLSVLLKVDSYEHRLAAKNWYGRLIFKQNVGKTIFALLEHPSKSSKCQTLRISSLEVLEHPLKCPGLVCSWLEW